ncbi:MAG: phage holin family protein [Clostridia bacterium]|nr:phage holin family protein [Clostridia bacterium]
MNFEEFIKPELLILIPVLYLIGTGIKKSKKISDSLIPIILGGVGVLLSALWVLAISDISSGKEIAVAIFTAVTQGILIAGASVYSNQLIKQLDKKGD